MNVCFLRAQTESKNEYEYNDTKNGSVFTSIDSVATNIQEIKLPPTAYDFSVVSEQPFENERL